DGSSTFARPKSRPVWTAKQVTRARGANTVGSRASRSVNGRETMPRRTKSEDAEQSALGRRGFLKAATLAGTGAIASAGAIGPQANVPEGAKPESAGAAT